MLSWPINERRNCFLLAADHNSHRVFVPGNARPSERVRSLDAIRWPALAGECEYRRQRLQQQRHMLRSSSLATFAGPASRTNAVLRTTKTLASMRIRRDEGPLNLVQHRFAWAACFARHAACTNWNL